MEVSEDPRTFDRLYIGMEIVWNYGSTRGNMIQKVV
jgi:hypothetical protein